MKKRFYLKMLTTCLLVIGLVPGCDDNGGLDCDCPPLIGRHFKIKEMRVNHLGKTGGTLRENSVINFSNYQGLDINYVVDFHASIKNCQRSRTYFLVNTALACSCVEPGQDGSKTEKIEDIQVITLNSFDQEFAANDTINDIITTKYLDKTYKLNDFLKIDKGLIRQMGIGLNLSKPPTLNNEFKVRVIFKLNTGEVFTINSDAVFIN